MTVFARRRRGDVIRRGRLRNDVGKTRACGVTLCAVVSDSLVIHRVDGVVRRVRMTQRAGLRRRNVIGRLCQTGRERHSGTVTLRAFAGRRVVRVLCLRRSVDHGDAEPIHSALVTASAVLGDSCVTHCRAGTESRESRRRVTVLARQGGDRQVIRRRRLGHDVGEAQTRGVALRAIAGDPGVIHLEDGIVLRVRVTQRASLRRRNVVVGLLPPVTPCENDTVEVWQFAHSPVAGWFASWAAVGRSTMVTPYQLMPFFVTAGAIAGDAGVAHRRAGPESTEVGG